MPDPGENPMKRVVGPLTPQQMRDLQLWQDSLEMQAKGVQGPRQVPQLPHKPPLNPLRDKMPAVPSGADIDIPASYPMPFVAEPAKDSWKTNQPTWRIPKAMPEAGATLNPPSFAGPVGGAPVASFFDGESTRWIILSPEYAHDPAYEALMKDRLFAEVRDRMTRKEFEARWLEDKDGLGQTFAQYKKTPHPLASQHPFSEPLPPSPLPPEPLDPGSRSPSPSPNAANQDWPYKTGDYKGRGKVGGSSILASFKEENPSGLNLGPYNDADAALASEHLAMLHQSTDPHDLRRALDLQHVAMRKLQTEIASRQAAGRPVSPEKTRQMEWLISRTAALHERLEHFEKAGDPNVPVGLRPGERPMNVQAVRNQKGRAEGMLQQTGLPPEQRHDAIFHSKVAGSELESHAKRPPWRPFPPTFDPPGGISSYGKYMTPADHFQSMLAGDTPEHHEAAQQKYAAKFGQRYLDTGKFNRDSQLTDPANPGRPQGTVGQNIARSVAPSRNVVADWASKGRNVVHAGKGVLKNTATTGLLGAIEGDPEGIGRSVLGGLDYVEGMPADYGMPRSNWAASLQGALEYDPPWLKRTAKWIGDKADAIAPPRSVIDDQNRQRMRQEETERWLREQRAMRELYERPPVRNSPYPQYPNPIFNFPQ